MHRNLFAPVSLLVLGLVGCRAQEESKALQNSVTRLEQKLSRLDESMRAQQAEQEAGKDAKAANDKAIAELKRALDEARAKAERAEAGAKQRVEDAMAKARNEDQGRQRALDEREAGELRQQMARQQGERRGDDGRMEALERLAAERREVEKLRAQVMADVARGKQQDPKPEGGKVEVAPERLKRLSDEMAKLRAENEKLKKALADAKQAMAGGKQADGDRFVFVDVDDDGLPDARAEARNAPDRRVTVMQLPEGTPPTKPTSKRIASRDGMFVLLDEGTPPTTKTTPTKAAPQKWNANSPVPAPPMPPAAAPKTMTLPLAGGGSLTIENEHCEVHIHVHGNAAPTDKAGPTPPKTVRLRKGEDAEVVEVITAPQPQQETPPAAAPKAIRARRVGGEQPAETTPVEAKPPANAGGGKDAGKQPAAEPKKAAKTVGTRDAETVDEALLEYVLELLLGPV